MSQTLRNPKLWLLVVVLLLVASVPFTAKAFQQLTLLTMLFVTLSVAWNIIGGYAGQTSFGHAAFYGLGAYTTAILAVGKLGAQVPALLTLPLAGVVAAIYAM